MSRWIEPRRVVAVEGPPGAALGRRTESIGGPVSHAEPPSTGSTRAEPGDTALTRIAKYIPGEVIAGFTMLFTVLVSLDIDPNQQRFAALGLIALFLAVTVGYIWRALPAGKVREAHLFVSSFAFIAWAYPISSSALGNWFEPLAAFGLQAAMIALSYFVNPLEE